MLAQDLIRKYIQKLKDETRSVGPVNSGAPDPDDPLGPLALLQRNWVGLPGHGWNMIALPFATPPGQGFNYRLLLNQYDETLDFNLVDKGVPNRGILRTPAGTVEADQRLAAIDYVQNITQIAAADFPVSGEAGDPGLPIHHEPGLWLHILDENTNGLDIARLSTIPHGDSVLALGTSGESAGGPDIPDINGLPVGVDQDLNNPYLEPYKHFHDNLFEGVFDPVSPNDLLKQANSGVNIARTTTLPVDTAIESGGIVNIPFIVKQANAAEMKSTFWIQELEEKDGAGNSKLRLQYSQIVILDFFPRRDGMPGLIRWPHISINTLVPADD